MANNVYIGSRYVPVFDGDWDSTKTYEPLTIVNYNGGSYTSKRPVPAGTLPTNTTYWALSGTYNGQIAALQTRVGNLEDAVEDIPTQRHIIICGDSYVQGIGGGGTTIESALEAITNWDVRSFYAGGCGYLRANDQNKKMYDVVQDAVNNTTDKAIITDVVLSASVYNDTGMSGTSSFTKDAFITALTNINALIKANFPKARVTVIPSLWINISYNTDFNRIFEWTMAGAQSIGANYADNSLDWLMVYDSSVDSGDHVHPSATGFTIIANHIASVLNGCQASLYNGMEVVTSATNDNVFFKYYKDHVHIKATISKESGQTFTSLFSTPAPLQKLTNYPVPFVVYGSGVVKYFLITNATTYLGSDWLEEGTTYLIDYDVPYNNIM